MDSTMLIVFHQLECAAAPWPTDNTLYLSESVTVNNAEGFAINGKVDSAVEVLPVVVVSHIILGEPLAFN